MIPARYIVITPIRDEEAYIDFTFQSILNQTIRPLEWIIVNDGSVDNTAEIINRYANKYNWIKAIHRRDRGFRNKG